MEGGGLNLGPQGQMLAGGNLASGFMDQLCSQFITLREGRWDSPAERGGGLRQPGHLGKR